MDNTTKQTRKKTSISTTSTASTSRNPLAAEPPLFALLAGEIAEEAVPRLMHQGLQALRQNIDPQALARLVAAFGKAMKWQRDADKPAYLQALHAAIARFAEPVVVECMRRLIETEEWMPPIAKVLSTCNRVYFEAFRHIWRLGERRDAAALVVKQAEREVRASLDDATQRALDAAERQEDRIERRRGWLEADRKKLAEEARSLPRAEAGLRQYYQNTLLAADWTEAAARWRGERERDLARRADDIARQERELAELEAEPRPLAGRLRESPGPRRSFIVHGDGRITDVIIDGTTSTPIPKLSTPRIMRRVVIDGEDEDYYDD